MQRINDLARKASDILETITVIPLMIMGGAMVVVVVAGTFWRYVLNNPLLWTEEVARYLMIYVVLVGASVAMKHREHVRINVVMNVMPAIVQKIVRFLTNLLMAYFLYILITYGWQMALRARFQVSPALGIQMFWPMLAVPLTGLFTLLQLALQMIIDVSGGEK